MLCLRLTYTEPKLTRLNFTTYRQSILLFKFPTLFLKNFTFQGFHKAPAHVIITFYKKFYSFISYKT